MKYYIGIDLGTSSVKVLLLNKAGEVCATVTKEYPLFFPQPGYSEQNPEDWYFQTLAALTELLRGVEPTAVCGISFSGQMHGLVLLDEDGQVIRPAILWNDARAAVETEQLNAASSLLPEHTGNIAFAGFTLPKLLWVKEHEPEHYRRIHKILLPKDYLLYRLTGEFCSDVSDASGTLYFDVEHRRWSATILKAYGIDEGWLPRVVESDEQAGTLAESVQAALGLGAVPVMAGAGDNAAAAVGTGTVKNGSCNLSLGTSGTLFVVSDTFCSEPKSAIHAFCSAGRNYHYMAVVLSAAVCSNWWVKQVLRDEFDAVESRRGRLGQNEVLFLPYLMGERSPLNDTDVRGLFYGMSLQTEKDDLSLAVLEGVAFALRQNLDVIRRLGVTVTHSTVCGGGAKNRLWLTVLANVLGVELRLPRQQDGAALGAALLAAKGVLSAADYAVLEQAVYVTQETVVPTPELSAAYEAAYARWLRLYPAIKGIGIK